MNATELADELDKCMEDGSTDLVCVEQAATMLRQQQAEIEALKQQVGIWEKETMNARIKMSLYQAEIKELRKVKKK